MIRVIKLTTGEEVVGVVEEKSDSIFVKWPVKLVMHATEGEEKPRVRVELFAAQVKGHSVEINNKNVLYVGEPVPELRDYYDTNFGKMVPQPVTDEA